MNFMFRISHVVEDRLLFCKNEKKSIWWHFSLTACESIYSLLQPNPTHVFRYDVRIRSEEHKDSNNYMNREKGYKPRLRWSCELQNKFIDAVNQLGGPDKATLKGLMRIKEIPELTLYHLKSHLQTPLGAILLPLDRSENLSRVPGKRGRALSYFCPLILAQKQHVSAEAHNPRDQIDIIVTENYDDQKKIYEQNKAQRLLQVRIEAQGKYLQSVSMKAQETLSVTHLQISAQTLLDPS